MLRCDADAAPRTRRPTEPGFYYFAYGSCMCPLDLQRSLGENTHPYVIGAAALRGYRLGFHYYSPQRRGGALDILPCAGATIHGVLYRLPWRLSERLDYREAVHTNGYRREFVTVTRGDQDYGPVRTYVVVEKTAVEIPPDDWYFNVVRRGAISSQLPEPYCRQLLTYMRSLQMTRVSPRYLARPTDRKNGPMPNSLYRQRVSPAAMGSEAESAAQNLAAKVTHS